MEEKKKLSDALYELDDLDAPLWAIAGELETLWDSMANGNYDACPTHIGAVYLRSIREHRDLSLGTVLIAKSDGIGYYILEVGVKRRLAVTSKGDYIGRRTSGNHLLERSIEHSVDILASIEASLTWVLVVPATLAVDAVEAA